MIIYCTNMNNSLFNNIIFMAVEVDNRADQRMQKCLGY